MKKGAIQKYRKSAPEFGRWLEENVEEGLTIYQFPKEHRRDKESALRVVSGVIIEIHEEWITGKI